MQPRKWGLHRISEKNILTGLWLKRPSLFFCLRRPHFFPQRRGRFRVSERGTLLCLQIPCRWAQGGFSSFFLRRPHFFPRRKKWGKERRPKPMVFGFPSGRFRCDRKRHLRESATSLPALPLTWWSQEIGGSTDLSDYQIAHLPPTAASAGAVPWAAENLRSWYIAV